MQSDFAYFIYFFLSFEIISNDGRTQRSHIFISLICPVVTCSLLEIQLNFWCSKCGYKKYFFLFREITLIELVQWTLTFGRVRHCHWLLNFIFFATRFIRSQSSKSELNLRTNHQNSKTTEFRLVSIAWLNSKCPTSDPESGYKNSLENNIPIFCIFRVRLYRSIPVFYFSISTAIWHLIDPHLLKM